jgi:hypothetical protein
MENEDKDVNEAIQEAAKELYRLTVLAEGKRISNVGSKTDFSYMSTYFQQVRNYLN